MHVAVPLFSGSSLHAVRTSNEPYGSLPKDSTYEIEVPLGEGGTPTSTSVSADKLQLAIIK